MSNDQKNLENHHNISLQGFYSDAKGLSLIYKSGRLAEILEYFKDYEAYLAKRLKEINSSKLIKKFSNGTGIIEASLAKDELRDIFYIAHVAACCATFSEWKIPYSNLEEEALRTIIANNLLPAEGLSKQNIRFLGNRLGISDTIRSIQILRLLGLFKTKSPNIRQISFAASAGYRDMRGFHPTPVIIKNSNVLNPAEASTLSFQLKQIEPETLVLVDNNSLLKERYEELTNENPDKILGIVDDADKAIAKLPGIFKEKNWKPFNCIVGIRIDHRMIPDVKDFITSLIPIMDDTADLIISVGSGDKLDDFIGRKTVMQKIFDYLKCKKLSPVKISMHGGDSIEEQFSSPSFGASNFTTYELLHCKLKRKKL